MKYICKKELSEPADCQLLWKFLKFMLIKEKYYKEQLQNLKRIETNKLDKGLYLGLLYKKSVILSLIWLKDI
jgi:hypothetical protein